MVETAKLEIRALKNDTVEKLAKRYNTTESEILAENPNLKDGEKIATGTKITLPVSVFEGENGAKIIKYNVRKNDCLSMTAWQLNDGTPIYGTNGKVRQIADTNNISNPNLIYTNQEFDVPINADSFVRTTEPEVVEETDETDEANEAGAITETEEKPGATIETVEETDETEEGATTKEESDDEGSSVWGWIIGGAALIGAGFLAYKYRGQIADGCKKVGGWFKNLFSGKGKEVVEETGKVVEETGKVFEETGKVVEETGKVVEETGNTVKEISKDAEALVHPNGYAPEELEKALEEVEAAEKAKKAAETFKNSEALLHPNGYAPEELEKALEEVEVARKAKETAETARKAEEVESYAAGELDELATGTARKAEETAEKAGTAVRGYTRLSLGMNYTDATEQIRRFENIINSGKELTGIQKSEYVAALRIASNVEKTQNQWGLALSRTEKIKELTGGKYFAA